MSNGEWLDEDRRREQLEQHGVMLGRMETKFDVFYEDFKNHKMEFKDHVKSDNEQFLKFSRFMWLILGGFAAIEVGMKLWGLFR